MSATPVTVCVPGDSRALSVGADKVARALDAGLSPTASAAVDKPGGAAL